MTRLERLYVLAAKVEEAIYQEESSLIRRQRLASEIPIPAEELDNPPAATPIRTPAPCGTEKGYQQHRWYGEKCDECRVAHAAHIKEKSRKVSA